MKAAQLEKYAKNYQLVVNNIPIPAINENEVLVRVKVAAVNPLENLIGSGSLRLLQNYSLPQTMGNEITGIVEKIGSNVRAINVGDKVYSRLPMQTIGGFAEYVAVDANAISLLPANLDFVSGAAAALTGLTAYQGLREELKAKSGQTVFIPGGSGSFGQMAIPIAKNMGLTVIVSGSAAAKERTLAIGADQYLDFKRENYWEVLKDVDFVIDTRGPNEIDHELSIIKPGGRLLSLIAGPNKRFAVDHHLSWMKRMLFGFAGRKFDKQAAEKDVEYHFIFVRSSGTQLAALTKIIEANRIIPAIDATEFHIEDINEAIKLVTSGHPKGKVVIKF
ncbi:oxidoreductase [Lactobacillus sp. CBA3605]|uniref:NADP-dependent oxidoreductase n=1 Tax=Lactobacillus sp. CBA3605 TaxID=2099788 RepID=UPI000CFE0FE2|nr:NADP-dependent oxidoreductase [Lactobacillus sp. CBA3605]AVK61241.1 oxidoreductase [Lactobacillus sp. CBA3605]